MLCMASGLTPSVSQAKKTPPSFGPTLENFRPISLMAGIVLLGQVDRLELALLVVEVLDGGRLELVDGVVRRLRVGRCRAPTAAPPSPRAPPTSRSAITSCSASIWPIICG